MRLLFAPFSKTEKQDDGTLIAAGVASSEREDSDGEIIKADAVRQAIPDYMQFGAVREMHQNIAAGTALTMSVDDEGVTHLEAHIVDPVSVKKVQTGVLKGFSLGGSVKSRDPKNKKTITGIGLTEISLVDRPANPDAVLQLVKFDGEGRVVEKVAERSDTTPTEGKDKYGDVAFADEKNKKYPIDTEAHVRAALSYWGKPKNREKYSAADQKTIGGKIRAAAKKFGIDAEKATATGDLQKGMYAVAQLAQLVDSLNWLRQSVDSEEACENDEDSVMPARLTGLVQQMCEALTEMVGEESAELVGLLGDGTQLRTGANMSTKADETVDLAKAAKGFLGHFQKLQDSVEKIHKAAGDLHEAVGAHMDHLKKMHGEMTGTADEPAADDAAAKAAKAATAADPLEKRFAALEAKLTEEHDARVAAEKQVEALADGIAKAFTPAKRPALKVVGKEDDGALGKAADDAKDDKDPVSLIKRAHAHPIGATA